MTAVFQKILVPIDFSTHAHRALEVACQLAVSFDASLTLFHKPAKAVLTNSLIANSLGVAVNLAYTGAFVDHLLCMGAINEDSLVHVAHVANSLPNGAKVSPQQ